MFNKKRVWISVALCVIFVGCYFFLAYYEKKMLEKAKLAERHTELPLMENINLELFKTENAILTMKLSSKKRLEYEDYMLFPEGIQVEWFEANKKSATVKAQYGYYDKKTNTYQLKEDVYIQRIDNATSLFTQELFLELDAERMYTEKAVQIQTEEDTLNGIGLVAKQDFSDYTILKPTGTFQMEEPAD